MAVRFLVLDETEQECDDLIPLAGLIGAEGTVFKTAGDPLLHRPQNGLAVVSAGVHIGEGIAHAGRPRLDGITPQERHDLGTGTGLVGAKGPVLEAGGDSPIYRP